MVGEPAVHLEHDPVGPPAGELHREPPERRCEWHERRELLHLVRPERRAVDRVRDEATVERRDHLLGDDHARAILCLLRRRGEVRCDDDVVEFEERSVVRFRREHVETRAGHLARAQRCNQRLLVDELAARGVDDPDAVLGSSEHVCAEHAPRLVGEGEVKREEVGAYDGRLDGLDRLGTELADALGRDVGVVRDHAHPERQRSSRHLLADATEPENGERLPRELVPRVRRTLPATSLERRVRLRDVARQGKQQSDRVLRGGDDRRLRGVRNDDPEARGCVDVDVVDADAGAADHLQARRAIEQRPRPASSPSG